MKLIRALLDRLSESFVVSVSEKLELATEPSNSPPLRLVSDKPLLSVPVDTIPRRSAGHSVSHVDALDDAVRRSQAWFVSRQDISEGYWVAELEADTTLTSEYLMLRRFLDRVDPERERKAVSYLRAMQLPDGGWPIFYGGPSGDQCLRQSLFCSEIERRVCGRALHVDCQCLYPWQWAVSWRPMCSPKSPWRCLINMIGGAFRACRQKSCCCRNGFISASMRFPIGRGPC